MKDVMVKCRSCGFIRPGSRVLKDGNEIFLCNQCKGEN